MFCSFICRENAFKMYHKFECLNKSLEREYVHLSRVMRLFYFALYLFDDKIKDLKAFILSRGEERKNLLDFDMRDLDPIEAGRNKLLCYDSLVPTKRCTEVEPFHLMFENHSLLKIMWKKERKFIEVFLYRHYDITARFNNILFKWPADAALFVKNDHDIILTQRKVGAGYYIFSSMFNHSCVANVQLHCDINNKMHMIICKNVAKGEQLLVNYK